MDLTRLAYLVEVRRNALDLKQEDAADLAGISLATWNIVENPKGSKPQGSTLAGVDRALRWHDGSARRALEGGDPEPVEDATGETTAPSLVIDALDEAAEAMASLAVTFRRASRQLRAAPGSPLDNAPEN